MLTVAIIPCPHTDQCVLLNNWKEERWAGEKASWIAFYCRTDRSLDCDLRFRQDNIIVEDLEFTWFNVGLVKIRRAIFDLGLEQVGEHYSQGEQVYRFTGMIDEHTYTIHMQITSGESANEV